MWLVMNIGCIECGVSSAIVGVFSDKEKAEEIAGECFKLLSWRQSGQNEFEVFEIPETDKIADEYATVLNCKAVDNLQVLDKRKYQGI